MFASILSLVSFGSSVVALRTVSQDKAKPLTNNIFELGGSFNKDCVIDYEQEKLTVNLHRFGGNGSEESHHYHSIEAVATSPDGSRFSTSYFLYGDKSWRFRAGPGPNGAYVDRTDTTDKAGVYFSMINPFYEMMPSIVEIMDDGDCTKAAVYIEQHPPRTEIKPEYKPGTVWLHQYFIDRKWLAENVIRNLPGWTTPGKKLKLL
ncbi:hypothetical protein FOZ62_003614 [Perkinsus olseni]|uniref:Uncharacterized protein n=1 Tax=Perkinsus olseni TaxID=32597 RepID=A0A7J6PZP6_PEROL|nr:hypothetical protein FOZ62_003614 [Perkinsus olseni]